MTALQAEKERLMRSVSEKEAELSSLRQSAQAQQSSLQQERERSSRELGELQGKLQEKVSRDSRAELSNVKPPLCTFRCIQQYFRSAFWIKNTQSNYLKYTLPVRINTIKKTVTFYKTYPEDDRAYFLQWLCLHELQFLSLQPEDNTVQLRLVLNQDYDSWSVFKALQKHRKLW